jgi:hypothetical protein
MIDAPSKWRDLITTVTIEHFPTRLEAEQAERAANRRLSPCPRIVDAGASRKTTAGTPSPREPPVWIVDARAAWRGLARCKAKRPRDVFLRRLIRA